MTPITNPAVAFLFILLLLAGIAAFVWIWAPEGTFEPVSPREPANTDAGDAQWLVIPEVKDGLVMAEIATCRVNRPERRIPVRSLSPEEHREFFDEWDERDRRERNFWLCNSGDSTSPSYSPLFQDDD